MYMCVIYVSIVKYVFTFLITCSYVHTQGGVQAIHNAATHGHIGLISVLVEKYSVDPQVKADVSMLVCS